MTPREEQVAQLFQSRPRDRVVRGSIGLLAFAMVGAWVVGPFEFRDAFSARRLENLQRFAASVCPEPLRGEPWDWSVAFEWLTEILRDHGNTAILATLAISMVAINVAASIGLIGSLLAARNVVHPAPFGLSDPSPPSFAQRGLFAGIAFGSRAGLIFLRSLPEFIWAFLLVAILGPTPWVMVLALAFHNAGILGRLNAELVENCPAAPLRALRGMGATRGQVMLFGLIPITFPRFLLFYFYRWESCVRDATILGMLNIVSLGFWIDEYRGRMQYDRFVLMILLGSALVLVGDLASATLRRAVRNSA